MFRVIGLIISLFSLSLFAIEKVAPKEASLAVESGSAILVDVREANELIPDGKAEPARHLAKSSIDNKDKKYQAFLASAPIDKSLIFYCRSGKRAEVAAEAFAKLGYATLNMGSFKDWVEAGLPVN